jgi:zinc/manganese transport system substrate-binding protein
VYPVDEEEAFRMIKVKLLVIGLLITLCWPHTATAKLKVVATLTDLGWIAEQVGGDKVEVEVLCPGDRDPHYLPAKPSLARKLSKADLLVYNGLELEIGWLPLLIDAARNPRIRPGDRGELDCSLAVASILEVPAGVPDRSQGDIHPLGNPHYLSDPRNAIAVGYLMANRLAELDPAAADTYLQRAEDLATALMAQITGWQEKLATVQAHAIVVYHKQWEYLLDWLGLEVIGEIEHRPGISPSPRHVDSVIRRGKERGNVVVIAAPWNHLDAARKAADRMEAPMVVLPAAVESMPGTDTYYEVFDVMSELLIEAVAED